VLKSKWFATLAVIAGVLTIATELVSLGSGYGSMLEHLAKGRAASSTYVGALIASDWSREENETHNILETQKRALLELKNLPQSPERDEAIPIVEARIAAAQKAFDQAHIRRLRDGKDARPPASAAVPDPCPHGEMTDQGCINHVGRGPDPYRP